MRRVLFVTALMLGLVPILANRAFACSCVSASPLDYARAADVVFTGKAIAKSETVSVTWTAFDVDTVYKGSPERYRIIESAGFNGGCGYGFVEGQRYTVFTSLDRSGRWQTGTCSGNVSDGINPARYKLNATPVPQTTGVPSPVATTHWSSWLWLILGVGSFLVFGLGYLAGRQRHWTASS